VAGAADHVVAVGPGLPVGVEQAGRCVTSCAEIVDPVEVADRVAERSDCRPAQSVRISTVRSLDPVSRRTT
jgi:hypothetical protein